MFSRSSSKIHPDYFRLFRQGSGIEEPKLSALLHDIVQTGKAVALLSLSALCLSFIPVTARTDMLSSRGPLPSPVASELIAEIHMAEVDRKLRMVGEVLSYLVGRRIEGAQSASPRSVATCRVSVPKATLRIGPGKNFSPLMTVGEGTELVVESEHGSWLRVLAPTSERAWISTDVVSSF